MHAFFKKKFCFPTVPPQLCFRLAQFPFHQENTEEHHSEEADKSTGETNLDSEVRVAQVRASRRVEKMLDGEDWLVGDGFLAGSPRGVRPKFQRER